MINILFFFMCLVASITGHRFDSRQSKVKEAHVKSIHTKFGYIVDCVDIYKQPAFDHPLLMNHKLQRKPNFQNRQSKTSLKNSSTRAIFGVENDKCPRGTVPIRRTSKDDIIRGKSFFNNVLFEQNPINHVAEVTLITAPKYFSYYGVSGTTSVYNVKVEKDQSSTSMMWVRNGPIENTNLIGIGWHVVPQLYNDDATHMFAVWTADNFNKVGCFNLLCSGFVQTSQENYLGSRFDRTSIYGGEMIEMSLSIIQDPGTKNWWLNIENENIGYFPASLFSNLTSATQVAWGGRTTTSKGSPSPPMGSGNFPDNVINHACYFKDVTYQNDSRKSYGPNKFLINTFSDKPNCFLAQYYGDEGEQVGNFLQFGGPGGNCGD